MEGVHFLEACDVKIEHIDPVTNNIIPSIEFEEVTIEGRDLISSPESLPPKTSKFVFMCKPCNSYFPTKHLLEEHHKQIHQKKKVTEPVVVDNLSANNKEVRKNTLKGYYKDLESNKFVCAYCPFQSSIRSTVSSHSKRTHENPLKAQLSKEFIVEEIEEREEDEVLKLKIELMDADEDDEASWPIETVDENFDISKSNQVSDTEDLTRNCPYCPFETTVSSTYHSHIKRKHREAWAIDVAARAAALKPPEGPELFCPHCDFKTHKRNTLHSHVKRKHGLKRKREDPETDMQESETPNLKKENASEEDESNQSKVRNCPYCDFKTTKTVNFNAHILRKHAGQANKNELQSTKIRNKSRVNNFMITGYACHYCTFIAATLHSITSHGAKVHGSLRQSVQEVPTDSFDCDRCEHKSRNRRHMQTHLKKNHKSEANSEGMYSCSSCSYETMSHMGLQRHISIKHQKVNSTANSTFYQCEICEFSCLNVKIMDWHLKSHEESTGPENSGKTYTCNDCDFSTWAKTLLHSHIRRKHKEGESQIDNLDGETVFVCEQCDYSTKNKHVMKVHVIRKHTENYSYECELCGKKYKVKADLTNHVRFKHREQPIICDVCGKTCQNSNLLYLHQKFAHYKPEFECHICHRRMVSQANLDDHILKQHEQREDAICEECGKTFTRAARLKIHMRVHTGVKPYACSICFKAFARRNGLRQHLLIHTGKRPYICDICGKSFTQKTGLISHRKSHPGSHPPLPRVTIDHVLTDFLTDKTES